MLEEPFNGFTIGLVAEFSGELKDPGGAQGRHPDPPPSAINLGVAILVGASPRRKLLLLGLLLVLGSRSHDRAQAGALSSSRGGSGGGGGFPLAVLWEAQGLMELGGLLGDLGIHERE